MSVWDYNGGDYRSRMTSTGAFCIVIFGNDCSEISRLEKIAAESR